MSQNFDLPVGLNIGGIVHKEAETLPTNGIAERIFTKKLGDQPYTWQGYIIAVAIKRIGDILIGAEARKKYLEDGYITIPKEVERISIADANTLMVEIHRNCWDHLIKKQKFICRHCGKQNETDVDLKKISLPQEDIDFLATNPDLTKIVVYLPDGFNIGDIKELSSDKFLEYRAFKYNKLTYRIPNLADAIRNEGYADDEITFWRRIAADCLIKIESVDNADTNEEVSLAELPQQAISILSLRLYDLYLGRNDLKAVREELIEYLPTLPFFYEDSCGHCSKKTPFVMEATNFFSA